jgi:fatty-acid desaturase
MNLARGVELGHEAITPWKGWDMRAIVQSKKREDEDSPNPRFKKKKGTIPMLMTIAIVLILLYALGLITSFTMGGFIHILLVAAIIVVLVRLIQGRRLM